jgi:hypothetical protein
MKNVEFYTPDIEEPHPHHPEAHNILRMFFRCLDELPDSAWSLVDTTSRPGEQHTVLETIKNARCMACGLELIIESSKSLSSSRPYADAAWTERATFHEPSKDSKQGQALAQIEIVGTGKLGADGAMARHETVLRIHAFDARGAIAQMGPQHWARALKALDLEGSFGEALAALRDSSESLFDSFIHRLEAARSAPMALSIRLPHLALPADASDASDASSGQRL